MSYLSTHGNHLLTNGFPIVPIRANTKSPNFPGLQNTKADQEQLSRWLNNGFSNGGGGY